MSVSNYSSVPQAGSPTHTEAWALTEAARRIAMALETVAAADDLALPAANRALRDNIRLNWRLWTIFQAELTLETNPIPMELRQNMLTLCQFVDNHTIQCMSDVDPEKIKILIDINRNIAQGLLEGISNELNNAEKSEAANKEEQPRPTLGDAFNTNV